MRQPTKATTLISTILGASNVVLSRTWIVLLLAGLALSCRTGRNAWVVLSEEQSRVLTKPCSRTFPPDLSGYWSPTAGDLIRAERRYQEVLVRSLTRAGATRPLGPD